MTDLVATRLRAQHLTGEPLPSVAAAVRHFGAVQSQDYPAAKWALGLRLAAGTVESDVDRAYDEGQILRTHVLRPTWHFVAPEDIRWMLALTGPKIRQSMASRYGRLELDASTIRRAHDLFEKALAGGRHMSRAELGQELSRAGIPPDGQRLPHLLASAELAGLVTSGPRKGRHLSFALLEERAPRARVLDREEAVAELTLRYFASHGPAQLRDFTWWSGLTQTEARRGLAAAGGAIEKREIDGATYWFDARLGSARLGAPVAHLLPNFDEYTVGYADRSAMLHPARPFRPELFAFSSILSNVLVVAGQVSGSWRRVLDRKGLRVEVSELAELSAAERRLVARAVERYKSFVTTSP